MSIELISDIKQANGGEFPLIDSNDIKGGLYSVDTESEMNSIPIVRLKDGMLCWVKEIQEYRRYNIDSNTWIESNLGNSSSSNGLTSSDVIDNLTTINTKAPLSANQGYQLNNSKFDDVEIIGTKLSFTANGNIRRFIQLPEQTYTLPTASTTQLGGIKVGAGLSINNGILSANGGGTADSVDWSNVQNKPTIPTKVSDLTNDSGFITSVPSEYITESELNSKGYLTEHQDISGKVDKVNGKGLSTNDLTNTLKSNYDTAYSHSQSTHAPSNAEANVQTDWNITDINSDAYIKNKPIIPTKTSQLTNDSGFITSVPNEYITETELNAKGYATEDYVTETVNNASMSGGYTHPTTHPASMITGLSTVATSGKYNDLINKPTIPTKTSQLTNDSGYLTEHQSLDGLATESYVDTSIANIVNSAPETLDTLNELATALGNDANFATTVSTQIGNKVDKVEGKGLSTNDLTTTLKSQYDTAYTHSQSTHFNGNYNDLNNRPTKLSQFTNDSGYLTNKDLPDEYILPNATSSSLGGVIVGDGLSVNGNGVISSNHNNDIINNLKLSYDSSIGVINLTYNNNIISSITIDISKKTYGIVNNLNNATTNNISGNIEEGSSYSAIITANIGYTISSITVTMNGENITNSVVSGNNINIPNVTGNIVITVNTSVTSYTITNNLINCTTSNSSNTISYNSSYSSVISVSSGYEISSITVTMGGTDITSSAVNGNNINISNVTGNIVITVNTSVSESGRELTTTILNMQYASAHEVLPNAPIDDVWKDRPREGKGSTIPTQNCTECASGTHTASESYSAGSLWSTFGQWATIYKIKGTNLVENVGVEITDFKMWRYNENTNQWVLINDTFDYGAFYYETFWDDGSAPLNDHKILSSDKKTYKCLMDSQTSGRCFHPFSAQKKWSDYGFTTNPSYIVVQMKARLIVWDENGADNRASANLCMNVGGDYWIRQGASFDDQWRHNGDMMVGYYKKITNDWRYVYMTTCPQTWNKGFPCDSAVDNGAGGTTSNPIELTLPSSMTCTKGEVFNITYNTNIEAVKHEMSWDGGSTYNEIYPSSSGTTYTYTHEAITDTTWNPVSRYIRVTDVNGNTSSGSISITINEEPSSGGTTDKIQLNLASTMNCTKGEAFNITYSTNIEAVKHEMSWDGGSTYNEVTTMVTVLDNNNYIYTHEAITDTTWNPVSRWIRVTDVNGNVSTSSISITINEESSSGGSGGDDGNFDNYIITYNLTNCTSSNTSDAIFAGASYSTKITADSGYTISGIIVTMGGIDITDTVVDLDNNINISSVNGDITITANAQSSATISYIINYNLVKCTSSNTTSYANEGSSYNTSITANSGYTLENIIVTMGEVDITSSVVSNNNISIPNVTGNIVIAAEATATSSGTSGTNILSPLAQWSKTSGITSMTTNGDYSATITFSAQDEEVYTELTGLSVGDSVTLSCSDISSNLGVEIYNANDELVTSIWEGTKTTTITVGSVLPYSIFIYTMSGTSGSISDISLINNATSSGGSGEGTGGGGSTGGSGGDGQFSVTYYLTDCTSTNTQTSVAKGDWYYSNIMVENEGTTIYVKVTMGGVDITSSVVDDNNAIYITNVTGDIVITASPTNTSGGTGSGGSSGNTGSGGSSSGSSTYTVTYNLSNCYTDNTQTSVSSSTYYYTNILPNSNYTISSAKVTMGGIDVTSTYLSNNAVYITNVTGNIVITATATANSTSGGTGSGGSSGTSGYTITYNLSNCYTDSTQRTVNAGDFYYTNVYPNDNYTMSNVSVTMGGVNVTSSAVNSNNVVYITNVTGNIVINATAVYGSGSSSGGSTGGTIVAPGTGGIIVAPDPGGGSTGGGSTTTYYNITYNLSYCSSYSSVSSIASGKSYSTTITPNSGYTMSNISVTMGGTNITSSVVSGNSISIYNVTGNVTITATATANTTQTYTNPTVTFNYGKAIVTQDGYTETFDLSYTQNTGYSGYSSSYSVSGNGQNHYLTLSNSGTSKFRINGKYPTSGGWMSTTSSNGGTYGFGKYPICYYNNGGWTYSMTNVNNSVPSGLLNTALKYFNATFSELNLSANGGTESTIELADYDETWAGVTTRYSRHFEVKLNRRVMTRDYGAYGSSTTANNKWTSTTVHELGHTLGLIDNASHLPSIYDYKRDKTKCLYLQANDVYALKYFLKNNFGVNITTGYDMNYETNYEIPEDEIQNNATILAYNLLDDVDETDAEFNFDYVYYEDNELEEITDVIVKCKLKYQTTDILDIHNSENDNFYLDYNIYEIDVCEAIKGELKNKLLKIHISENVEIDENKTYKIYLKQFENTPCSLINIEQGIIEL